MIAANDNQPRLATSFASVAERRVHVANTEDGRHRSEGACPLAVRLYKAGRGEDLRRLVNFGKVVFPDVWHQAKGNLPETDGEMLFDRVHETRPSPDELVAIAVQDAIRAWDTVGPISPRQLAAATERTTRRNSKGHITEWRGSDGRWRPVVELRRQVKGERRKTEEERRAEAEWHLRTISTGSFPRVVAVCREFKRWRGLLAHAACFAVHGDARRE